MKTIQHNWLKEFKEEIKDVDHVRIVSPFITDNLVRLLLENFKGSTIQFITRYNLNDFKSGVSSIRALKRLLEAKAEIKGIKGLHSKLYLFEKSVIITSANFTNGGFFRNKEFGVKSHDPKIVRESIDYFNSLWSIDDSVLTEVQLNEWEVIVNTSRAEPKIKSEKLKDYGKSYKEKIIGKEKKYFIKFFGKKEHRVHLDYHSKTEIKSSHCHYTLSFSRKSNDKRPRKYRDGDVVYMAMMLHGSDYAIFGKGITYAHHDERDIASDEDIKHVSWRKDWPILVRVHSTEFIDTTMLHCPKMGELISELDYESFDKTLVRHNNGEQNINPWNSLRQQADVQLSELGALWLEERFQKTMNQHGKVPQNYIDKFYQGLQIK